MMCAANAIDIRRITVDMNNKNFVFICHLIVYSIFLFKNALIFFVCVFFVWVFFVWVF